MKLKKFNFIKKLIIPETGAMADGTLFWREVILRSSFGIWSLITTFLIIPTLITQWQAGLFKLTFVTSAVYITTISCFIFYRIPYNVRVIAAVILIMLMGTAITFSGGFFSGGPLWFFASSIFAALLIGNRAALVAVFINAAFLFLYYQYDLNIKGHSSYFVTPTTAILAFVSFFLLNLATSVSTSVLVRQLQLNARREWDLINKMREEQEKLIQIKESLNNEVEIRKKAESYLRESEKSYRFMAGHINDVIWALDLELNYTYLSPVTTKVHGWNETEFSHLTVNDFLTPLSLAKAAKAIGEQLGTGRETGDYNKSAVIELEMYKKDGSTFHTEVTASFILDENSKPTGIMGVTRDISERIKIETERRNLQDKLERSKKMEALGLLAGGVAHDLNNVLSGIVSYPDLILIDMKDSDPLKKPVEVIRDSGLKAAAIVQDLLSLARRNVSNMLTVEMNEIIMEFMDSPEFIEIKNTHPDVIINKTLLHKKIHIRGSEVHIKKMITNLVLNAAEAQPGGGIINIVTECRYLDVHLKGYDSVEPGEYAVLQITDIGIGISDEDMVHIFEPFYTKKVMGRSGTGLGMAIVWGTVQDHNGYIDIASSQNEGTKIEIYFPLTRDIDSEKIQISGIGDYTGNGELILVVDDMEQQRIISTSILTRLGYSVEQAESGESAIEMIEKVNPDLVILDMIMDPGIDGLDTYKELLKKKPDLKTIIASGFSETDRVKEALEMGAGAYLKKPYYIENLGIAVFNELHKKV